MTQPPRRIGALAAARLLAPGALASSLRLAASMLPGGARWPLLLGAAKTGGLIAGALSITLAFIFFCLPFLGLMGERLFTKPQAYYAAPVSVEPLRGPEAADPLVEAVSALAHSRRQEALRLGSPVFPLTERERQWALGALRERQSALRQERERLKTQAWQRDSEAFFGALRSGKTLPQALALVRADASSPPAQSSEQLALARLERGLSGARRLWLSDPPWHRILLAWTGAGPSRSGQDAWVIAQVSPRGVLGFHGLILCVISLMIVIAVGGALFLLRSWFKKALDSRQPQLREAHELRVLQSAAGRPKAPSKTPRL